MEIIYPKGPPSLSPEFTKAGSDIKKGVTRVVIALIFYIILYLLLLIAGALLAASFAMLGWYILTIKIHYATLLVGGGLIVAGAMILYFLIKFIFENEKAATAGSFEVTAEDQPELFEFIARVSEECGTEFPRHIYLTPDVNAMVRFDSGIKEMLFPVKKDLVIGLGLVNMLNLSEFKAVIAHEFGHFSQKSLRAGSYVYVANKVICNMLFQNNNYGNMLTRIANVHGIIAFFIGVTIKIVQGIQWVQQQAFIIVNVQNKYLSRQMEFHADAIAASVAGGNNLNHALQMIELGDKVYQDTINQYNNWFDDGIAANNLYRDQRTSARYFALEHRLPLKQDLPVLNSGPHYFQSFSKVNIEDQWASHPTNEQREDALSKLNAIAEVVDVSAWTVFKDREVLEKRFTNELYTNVKWKKPRTPAASALFEDVLKTAHKAIELPAFYDNYYTGRPITKFATDNVNITGHKINDIKLFLQQNADLGRKRSDSELDTIKLNYIASNRKEIKKFNFDGTIYPAKMAETIKTTLITEAGKIDEQIAENDKRVYAFFCDAANKKGAGELIIQGYNYYFALLDKVIETHPEFGKLLAEIRPFYNGDEFDDIYKNSPQDMTDHTTQLKKLYREFKYTLSSGNGIITCPMPEKVVAFIEQELPLVNESKCSSQTVDSIYQRCEELGNWCAEAVITAKKQLLELQLQYC